MALQALHEHYWPGDGQVNPEEPEDDVFVYPLYMPSVVTVYSTPFFPVVEIPHFRRRVKLLWRVARLIFSRDFLRALAIVEEVAKTPGMHSGQAWGAVGTYMGKQAGVGENVYRHLLACQKWGPEFGPNLRRRHVRDSLLQLAFLAYKKERS